MHSSVLNVMTFSYWLALLHSCVSSSSNTLLHENLLLLFSSIFRLLLLCVASIVCACVHVCVCPPSKFLSIYVFFFSVAAFLNTLLLDLKKDMIFFSLHFCSKNK